MNTETLDNYLKNHRIRLIALDLDGTLLNTDKILTAQARSALDRAAENGIEIVPTTGRFYGGMPDAIRELPYIHYVISINGAQVYDFVHEKVVYRSELPVRQAVEIMKYLDGFDLIYDCYMDNAGWMNRVMWEKCADYTPNEHYRKMVHDLRKPVEDVKQFLLETGHDVQKVQLFTRDEAQHVRFLHTLGDLFPGTSVSTSVVTNVEINAAGANKGEAIRHLASYLGFDISETAAFGDGLNDLSMIRDTGLGVAMANACDEVLNAADYITSSCNEEGVSRVINRILDIQGSVG